MQGLHVPACAERNISLCTGTTFIILADKIVKHLAWVAGAKEYTAHPDGPVQSGVLL